MKSFISTLGPIISSYIDLKRNLGYKFQYAYNLLNFDNFLYEKGYNRLGVSEEIFNSWSERRPNESDVTYYNRINEVKNLLVYLNGIGYQSFIPRLPRRHASTFTPHIFTEEELQRFFKTCESMESRYYYQSHQYVCPALFRLLYGCGLRINEALSLKCEDVNLTNGYITVHETKNGEECQLPLSSSLKDVLTQYYHHWRKNIGMKQDYFFVKRNGEMCTSDAIYRRFRKILYCAGISHGGKGKGPRVHDLRYPYINKIRTIYQKPDDQRKLQAKGSDNFYRFIARTPQNVDKLPSALRHFLGADLSFSSSSVANAFASCSVVMSKYTIVVWRWA